MRADRRTTRALDEARDRFDGMGRARRMEEIEGVLRAGRLRVNDRLARDATQCSAEVARVVDVGERVVGALDDEEGRGAALRALNIDSPVPTAGSRRAASSASTLRCRTGSSRNGGSGGSPAWPRRLIAICDAPVERRRRRAFASAS